MKVHPAAELFPMMDGIEFDEFVQDIKEHGLRDPVEVLPDGVLVDGRNRLRACQMLGIKPLTVTVNPDGVVSYIVSKNLHRRHITSSQRAGISMRSYDIRAAEAAQRKVEGNREGGRKGGKSKVLKFPQTVAGTSSPDRETRKQLAKEFNTNHAYVDKARAMREAAPDLLDEVVAGKKSIPEAHREFVERTGKRAGILRNAADRRANDYVGKVHAAAGVCMKVNVAAIKRDKRLVQLWTDACRDVVKAARTLLNQLED